MARRDPVGIRLITRRGNDWTTRFPLVVEGVNHLKVHDGKTPARLASGGEVAMFQRGTPQPSGR